jgi:hypothetical protein
VRGEARPSGVSWSIVLAALFAAAVMAWRLIRDTHSMRTGLAVTAAAVLLGVAVVAWSRRRPARQLDLLDQTGRFEIDAGVSFASFPGDDSKRAKRSMLLWGANQPFLPCTLIIDGDRLVVEKRRMFAAGRKPIRATVALGDVVDVNLGGPKAVALGSRMLLRLRDGSELDCHLSQLPRDGQRIVDQLLLAAASFRGKPGPGGVVVDPSASR